MSFKFEYNRVLRKPVGEWAESELRFFGSLRAGSVSLGDYVMIPATAESVAAPVVRFMEDFDDWTGLPFYNTVDFDGEPFFRSEAFCICVDASSIINITPSCPSALREVQLDSLQSP